MLPVGRHDPTPEDLAGHAVDVLIGQLATMDVERSYDAQGDLLEFRHGNDCRSLAAEPGRPLTCHLLARSEGWSLKEDETALMPAKIDAERSHSAG
jgi:hypothetical protein